jgi:hypothetical protein
MRTGIKRLVLTKETLRAISNDELGKANGGVISAVNPAFGAGSGCAWSGGARWFVGGGGGGYCVD